MRIKHMGGGQDLVRVEGVLLFMAVLLLMTSWGVSGTCNHATIARITEHWGSNIPTNVLPQSVGDLTYVYLSPIILSKEDVRYSCMATRMDDNAASATDIYVHRNLKKTTVTYKKVENSGKITIQAPGFPEESQYIISFNNHVLVFWQCVAKDTSGNYSSLVGIAVDVNHLSDTTEEVLEAKKTLSKLGLNTGEDLEPCTPEMLYSKKRN